MVEKQLPGRAASPFAAAGEQGGDGVGSAAGEVVRKRVLRQSSTHRLTLLKGASTSVEAEPSSHRILVASTSNKALGSAMSGGGALPKPRTSLAGSALQRTSLAGSALQRASGEAPSAGAVGDQAQRSSGTLDPGDAIEWARPPARVSYAGVATSIPHNPPPRASGGSMNGSLGSALLVTGRTNGPSSDTPLSRSPSHRSPSRLSGAVPAGPGVGVSGGLSGMGPAAAANLMHAPSMKLQQKVAALRDNPAALLPPPEADPETGVIQGEPASRPTAHFGSGVSTSGGAAGGVGAPMASRAASRRASLNAGGRSAAISAAVSRRESFVASRKGSGGAGAGGATGSGRGSQQQQGAQLLAQHSVLSQAVAALGGSSIPVGRESAGSAAAAAVAAAGAGAGVRQDEEVKKPWRFPALSWAMQEMQEQAVLAQAMAQAHTSRPFRSWRQAEDDDDDEDEEEGEEEEEGDDWFPAISPRDVEEGDEVGAALSQRMSKAKLRVSIAGGALMAELSRRSMTTIPVSRVSNTSTVHRASMSGGAMPRSFSRAAGREGVEVPVVVAMPEGSVPPRRPPPDLVSVSDIPDDTLRALFKEVQQYGVHESVSDALHHLTDAQLCAMYTRASRRLEHLPVAVVNTGAGGRLVVPLPGPRGVPGWDVDQWGNTHQIERRRIGRYLGMSPGARAVLQQLKELEDAEDGEPLGMEEEAALVALWRALGGKRKRHTRLGPHARGPGASHGAHRRGSSARSRRSSHNPSRPRSRRQSAVIPSRRASQNGGMFLKGTQGGFGFGVGNRSSASHATATAASSYHGGSRRPTQDGETVGGSPSRRTTMDGLSGGRGGGGGARNKTRVARTLAGGVLGASAETNYYDGFKAQIAAMARPPPPPGSIPHQYTGRLTAAPSVATSTRSRASRRPSGFDGAIEDEEEEEVEEEGRDEEEEEEDGGKGSLLGRGSVEERKRALGALVDALQRASLASPRREALSTFQEGSGDDMLASEGEYIFDPSSEDSAGPEWSYLEGESDVSWDSWDGARSEGEGEANRSGSEAAAGGPATKVATLGAPPHTAMAGTGLLAALKNLAAAQRRSPVHWEASAAALSEGGVAVEGGGPGEGGAQAEAPAGGASTTARGETTGPYSLVTPRSPGRSSKGGMKSVGEEGLDEEEGEGEDPELEKAFKVFLDAMKGGKRPKVRRRMLPGEVPPPRTFKQAAAALRLGVRLGAVMGMTRKVRAAAAGLGGAAAAYGAVPDPVPEKGAAGSTATATAAAAAGPDVVGAFVDKWVSGAESGDKTVMSIDRLKELLLQGVTSKGDDPEGEGAIGAVSRARTRDWGPEMAPFIPPRPAVGTGAVVEAAAPSLSRAASAAPSTLGTAASGVLHSVSGVSSMAATSAAVLSGSVSRTPAPWEGGRGASGRARRGSGRLKGSSNNAAGGAGGQEVEPLEPRVAPKTVARRIAQAQAVGSPLLDLALAPHLGRADLGVVYQALLGAPTITHLRARDGVLTAGGVVGLLALLRACPFLQELDMSCTPAFGADAAEALGDALHPRHKLAVSRLQLQGCPIQDEGFMGLALGLQFNTTVRTLGLAGCGLGDDGLSALDQVLEQNVRLTSLDLSANTFSEKGVACLARDLKDNVAVRELRLRGCGLADGAAAELAGIISDAHALQVLDLSGNAITAKGAIALADALRRMEGAEDLPAVTSSAGPASGAMSGAAGATGLTQLPSVVAREKRRTQTRARTPTSMPQLHTLLLCDNPLGRAGVIALLQALDTLGRGSPSPSSHTGVPNAPGTTPTRSCVCALRRLGLDGVALSGRAGEVRSLAPFDPALPNGTYLLDLSCKDDRVVAEQLGVLWADSHGRAWLSATLDGQPLKLPHPPDVLPPDPQLLDDAHPRAVGTGEPETAGTGPAAAAADATPKGKAKGEGAKKGGSGFGPAQAPPKASPFPEGLPEEGVLKVNVIRCATVDGRAVRAMGPVLEACVLSQLRSDRASEVWKGQLVARLTNVTYVTSDQASRILSHFLYRLEKVDAASLLLSVCTDLWRLLPCLLSPPTHPPLAPRDPAADNTPCAVEDTATAAATAATADNGPASGAAREGGERSDAERRRGEMRAPPFFNSARPSMMEEDVMELINDDGLQLFTLTPGFGLLALGWHRAASGRYRLNLGMQTHRWLAALLVDAAHEQQAPWPSPRLSTRVTAALAAGLPHRPAHINVPGACLRNVRYENRLLGVLNLGLFLEDPWCPPPQMEASTLPPAGLLELEFVNPAGRRPRTHPHLVPPPPVVPGVPQALPWVAAKRAAVALGVWMQAAPSGAAAAMLHTPSLVRGSRVGTSASVTSLPVGGRSSPTPHGASVRSSVTVLGSVGEQGQQPPGLHAPHGHGTVTGGAHHVGFINLHPSAQHTSGLPGGPGVLGGAGGQGSTAQGMQPLPPMLQPSSSRRTSHDMASGPAVNASGNFGQAGGFGKRAPPLPQRVKRAKDMAAELGAAWEALFVSLLQLLGLSGHDPRLAGWLGAAKAWGVEVREDLALLEREGSRARHDTSCALPPVPLAAEATAADAGDGKPGKKGAGKKGPAGSKQSAKAAAKEAAAAIAAAEELEERITAAISAAGAAVSAIVHHSVAHCVTSLQAVHMLRLLPSLRLRLNTAVALVPALWDPSGLLDIALSLDAPVPITPSPPDRLLEVALSRKPATRQPPNPPSPSTRASLDALGISTDQPLPPLSPGLSSPSKVVGGGPAHRTRRASSCAGEGEANGPEILSPPPRGWPAKGFPGAEGASTGAAEGAAGGGADGVKAGGKAGGESNESGTAAAASRAVKAAAAAPAGSSRPRVGSTSGAAPNTSTSGATGQRNGPGPMTTPSDPRLPSGPLACLAAEGSKATWAALSLLASRLGWCALRLHWAPQGSLKGVIMEWDLSDPDQLLAAMRVCRWSDRAPGALIGAATNAGRLALEHGTGWSYWEQVLGWACWRPAVSNPDPPAAAAAAAAAPGSKKKSSAAGVVPPPPPTPKLGLLQLVMEVGEDTREAAAATLLQSVWRGLRVRRAIARALRDEATSLQPHTQVAAGGRCLGRVRSHGALDPELLAQHMKPRVHVAAAGHASAGHAGQHGGSSVGSSSSSHRAASSLAVAPSFNAAGSADLPGDAAAGAGTLHVAATRSVPARWQGAWTQLKYWRRVAQLQQLGLGLSLRHSAKEMMANADHLFPPASAVAGEAAGAAQMHK